MSAAWTAADYRNDTSGLAAELAADACAEARDAADEAAYDDLLDRAAEQVIGLPVTCPRCGTDDRHGGTDGYCDNCGFDLRAAWGVQR